MEKALNRINKGEKITGGKSKSALERVDSPVETENGMRLEMNQEFSAIKRYQKQRPPVDAKCYYSELQEKKKESAVAMSNATAISEVVPTKVTLPSELLGNVNQQKKESKPFEFQNADIEPMDDNIGKKKAVSAYLISTVLLHIYSFGVSGNQLYVYEEALGYWKMLPGNSENRALRALINEEYKSNVNKSMLSEIYEWLCVNAEVLDTRNAGKYYLNFKDCAVDWRTEECVTDRKNLYFDYYLDLNYKELEYYQNGSMKKFLEEIFGDDKKTKKEFAKFFGLSLSNIRNLKICGFFYGPSNTGKSVMLNLLKLLVGEQWTSSISFSQLSNEFAITRLLGKRLNVTGEVSGTSNRRLDIFKSLTGNDDIEICYKGKDHFSFSNKCLLVFACNIFPQIENIPEFQSFLSRIVIFPFYNAKPRSEWIDNMDQELFGDAKYVISFAMKGLRLLEEDDFVIHETEAMKACKKEFVELYDSFLLFAEKHIEEDPKGKVSSKEIEQAYRAFCSTEFYWPLNINIWGQVLKQKYRCKSCTVKNPDKDITAGTSKNRVRGYQGIRLKNVDEIEIDD